MSPIESKLTANQNVLDWGIYTVEAPPTGFNWSTNQQTVGSDATFVLSPTLPHLQEYPILVPLFFYRMPVPRQYFLILLEP